MKLPEIRISDGSVVTGPELSIMRKTDVVLGYLTLFLMVLTFIATVILVTFTDITVYRGMPILAIPFFVTGVIKYISERRWIAALAVFVMTVVAYVFDPVYAVFMLYVFVCAEGVAVVVEIIQRLIFYRFLTTVEMVNVKGKLTLMDHVILFLFNIPPDIDTRRITMDTSVRRDRIPWLDMAQTMVIALVLCVFLWIYMFLNPAFYVNTTGIPIHTFTIILYIAVLVMPWTIFNSLDVRITTDYRDFRLFSGLLETMKRMFLPSVAALFFLGIALSVGGFTFYYIGMSIVMIVVIIAFTSAMYYTRNEASVVRDIVSKWRVFHPADIYSGYDGTVRSGDGDFPGTPRRDPRSCFRGNGNQKY